MMNPLPILLAGAGGHARACIDVLESERRFTVVGLLGLADEVGAAVLGYKVLFADAELPPASARCGHALVTVGQIKSPDLRIRLYRHLSAAGYSLPVHVSPRAHVSRHATLGEGTIVMHGAVVNAGAVVGRNCIINSMALVEHDSIVGDHCHVATCATLNSAVYLGSGSFVGSNAAVRQGVRIGERCVIGMGQRVLKDCGGGSWLPPRRL